jgi:TetR/AcrR family transcriptional regulator, transcriptional repressor for nem operon
VAKIENSRRTIMDLAEGLLQDRGFNGFSYAHIAARLGVKNAAIHYHFPTKEALACAVIQRYRDRFKLWVNNSRVSGLPPDGKLGWFFRIYSDYRADDGKVCLLGALESEFNSLPAPLRAQTEALHTELLTWLQATLAEGREAGVFQFKGEPASKAALILSSVQGGLQMARALGTPRFRELLERHKQELMA